MENERIAILGNAPDRLTETNPWQNDHTVSRRPQQGFMNSVFGLLMIALPLGLISGYANILFLVSQQLVETFAHGMIAGYDRSSHGTRLWRGGSRWYGSR